jgi:phosphoglycolate phosphatase-like HAD superfamily hydrolase
VDPARLLMVGDSLEDVECGNAAGTATCLITGGEARAALCFACCLPARLLA